MEDLREFNSILAKLFKDILDYEESVLAASRFKDLTNNDMHVINAIGMDSQKNMSMIAKELAVTVGSLTIAINALVRKGYVIRERSQKDRRVVYVRLSGKGEKVFIHHENFHNEMVRAMLDGVGAKEMSVLLEAMTKVDSWIRLKGKSNKENGI